MRVAKLAMLGCLGLIAVNALAKPPQVPLAPTGEGRVPVYPDGEQYREPPAPPRRDNVEFELLPVRPRGPIVELRLDVLESSGTKAAPQRADAVPSFGLEPETELTLVTAQPTLATMMIAMQRAWHRWQSVQPPQMNLLFEPMDF